MKPMQQGPDGKMGPGSGAGMEQKSKKGSLRGWIGLAVFVLFAVALLYAFPQNREASLTVFSKFFIEMLTIIPGVLLIMGLFAVWVPKESITRYLGRDAGISGLALALVFGALPTGPLYAAFPLTKGLLDKGASKANMFVFLAAWACIKIPQELVELQFLGWRFTLARLATTILVIITMAFVFARVLGDRRDDAPQSM